MLAEAYVAVSSTLSARGQEELEEDGKKVVCVCVRARPYVRACVRPCVRPDGTKRKRNKRIGRRALARELARARVHASERADGPEDGMHIRHRKFCDIETLL